MANSYVTGYSGQIRTLAELQAWSQWQGLDPEYRRRALKLMDDSIRAGRPVGIGGTLRTTAQQESLFISRHYVVATGGCCTYNGKRYALHAGMAHAAPPGKSYHEPVTKAGKCLAIDFIGDMDWLDANCTKYGIIWISPEPWHGQPAELPLSRSGYIVATMDPLKPFGLPTPPAPAPLKVFAAKATMKVGTVGLPGMAQANVKSFQMACNMWGWRDVYNKELVVDGIYSQKSAQACMSMQRKLGTTVDGVYGPQSQTACQTFLNQMLALAGH